ncbi:MAG: ATP-dependent 6-phosphofructokinase [Nanoarchaeota archaeon]|nr:ATP-dependent 6-phosphofructokinase [Nanoarchaeota archaeon]
MTITGSKKKQIAVLTGGGDAPGLNAVIRGITVKAISLGYDVIGLKQGWAGLLENGESNPLDLDQVASIHVTGGTILGTSRTNPYKVDNGVEQVKANLKRLKCDALIAIGGEDTLGVANKLFKEGVNIVGVPKTIDNDLSGTDYTFGFDTAVNIAAKAIRDLHTTAESHRRIMVVEIMGRHAGWITIHASIAGGAHITLLPEDKFDVKEITKVIKQRQAKGKHHTIIAASEGAIPKEGDMVLQAGEKDAFGHVRLGGLGERLAKELEKECGQEARYVVLGHLQRSGAPSAFDVVLGTRLGVKATELVDQGKFGRMAALKGTEIVDVDLNKAVGTLKIVPKEFIAEEKIFWGIDD